MSKLPLITGLVLAGGQSRRMGRNKALLELNGESLINLAIERLRPQTDQLLISTNTPLPIESKGSEIPQLADNLKDVGPLGGVVTGLDWLQRHSDSEWMLTVAVDTPCFPDNLALCLWQSRQPEDLIVAARSRTKAHPTFALWHKSLLAPLSRFIAEDKKRRLMGFIDQQPHRYIDFDDNEVDLFNNINTPEDLIRLTQEKNTLE